MNGSKIYIKLVFDGFVEIDVVYLLKYRKTSWHGMLVSVTDVKIVCILFNFLLNSLAYLLLANVVNMSATYNSTL